MAGAVEWVAVDWGTSNLRAWGLDADDAVVFSRSSPEGMTRLKREDYPNVLAGLLTDVVDHPVDVLICGMAGARQGWIEAPYVDAPAALDSLADFVVTPPTATQFSVRILPGVCMRQEGAEDVMRGEETQLLGLTRLRPGFAGVAVMPGTHSKWGVLEGTELTSFTSAMTGEVFEALRTHSVLRHSLAGDLEGPERDIGFDAGLEAGMNHPGQLLGLLFKARSSALLSGRSPAWCAGYLSGLLIGSEIGGLRHWVTGDTVPLIGGAGLCALYARGFARLGVATEIVDATAATLAGLRAARQG